MTDDTAPAFPEYWDECIEGSDILGEEVESRFAAVYAHISELEEFMAEVVERCRSADQALDAANEHKLRMLELQSANAAQKAIINNMQKKIETFEATIAKQRRIIEDLEAVTDVMLAPRRVSYEELDAFNDVMKATARAQDAAAMWDEEDEEDFRRSMERDDRDVARRRLGLPPENEGLASRLERVLARVKQKKD